MTSGMLWIAMLVGLVLQFGVIYGAIRLALVHDRTTPAERKAKAEAVAVARVHS